MPNAKIELIEGNFDDLTTADMKAVQRAAELNGWDVESIRFMERAGRGSNRNGFCICKKPDGYAVHAWAIQSDGRAGLHNGNYVKDYNEAVSAFNRRIRNHPANPLH